MPVPSNVRKITRILETNILTSQFRKQGNLPFFNNAHIRFTTRAFYIIAKKKFKSWLANTWHIYWKGGDDVTCRAGCGFNEQNKSSALTLFVRKSLDNFKIPSTVKGTSVFWWADFGKVPREGRWKISNSIHSHLVTHTVRNRKVNIRDLLKSEGNVIHICDCINLWSVCEGFW